MSFPVLVFLLLFWLIASPPFPSEVDSYPVATAGDSSLIFSRPDSIPFHPSQERVWDDPELQNNFSLFPQPERKRKRLVDWSNPKSIDPLQEDILDFLFADLASWSRMANAAFASGKFRDAARYYLSILHHKYDDPTILYNLACCYGRMEDGPRAAKALWLAVQAGFDPSDLLNKDADFDPVRKDSLFEKVQTRILALLGSRGQPFLVQVPILLKCRLHLPRDFSAGKRYPLVIGLHGRGSNGDNLSFLWAELDNPQVIFVSADAPYSFPASIYVKGTQHTWSPVSLGRDDGKLADRLVVDAVKQVAQKVSSAYPIGETYILGFSQGAAYAYLSVLSQPETFRGVLAFSGRFPAAEFSAEQLAKAAASSRIFIAHGREDPTAPFSLGVEAKNTLNAAGFSVTFKEFSGGHSLPPAVLDEALSWLLKTEEAVK